MPLIVKGLDSLRSKLNAAQQELASQRVGELMEAVGVQALSLAQLAYQTKARGGTGSDGIKWAPLKESTIKAKRRRGKGARTSVEIGVDTGLQRASASPGHPDNVFSVQGARVTVGYGRSYSPFFDEKRPLLPDNLPAEWRGQIEQLVTDWGELVLTETLEG